MNGQCCIKAKLWILQNDSLEQFEKQKNLSDGFQLIRPTAFFPIEKMGQKKRMRSKRVVKYKEDELENRYDRS